MDPHREVDMPTDVDITQTGRASNRRGLTCPENEDELLCDAWMEVTQDLVCATDQNGCASWKRI